MSILNASKYRIKLLTAASGMIMKCVILRAMGIAFCIQF